MTVGSNTSADQSGFSGSSNGGIVDFESSGGTLVDFNDGHIPETFKSLSKNDETKLVQYPQHHHHATAANVHVYDNVLPPELVHALYETTINNEGSPWGAYVTLDDVIEYWERRNEGSPCPRPVALEQQDLAAQATACFLAQIMSSKGTTSWNSSSGSPLFSSWDELRHKHQVHGVAVWALASNMASQVQYHLDYAELIRYEHNVIVPPLFAGTIQCSQGRMEGGDFAVNTNGLSHYDCHGYKGIKSGDEWAGWTRPDHVENVDCNKDTSWVTIPYRYNRGICHTGHLPHLSTPVKALETGKKRVVVGFNVFCNDIGPLVQQAPEHSNAFRRRIQLHRSLLKKQSSASVSIERIKKSKGLTKLLVLAKREKVKQQLRQSQRQLDKDVDEMLTAAGVEGVRLETVMEKLGKTDGSWPNIVDVQVHVHHRVATAESSQSQDGLIRCSHDPVSDSDGILSANATLYLKTS